MNRVEKIINPDILAIKPYHVAPSEDIRLKLDAMECPHAFSEDLHQKWLKKIADVEINRYPSAFSQSFIDKFKSVLNISNEKDVIFGNGSDELIEIINTACSQENAIVMSVAPTFVMYELTATFAHMKYVSVDLNADFSLNLERMLAQIEKYQPAIIYLATPNNPTGNLYSQNEIEMIIQNAPGIVILDEAYSPFTDEEINSSLYQYDHVLVLRTLSKMGFAGLRCGYLFGNSAWISQFNKVRPPYNMNVLTQASIEFILDHYDAINQRCLGIKGNRQTLINYFKTKEDCVVYASQANFIVIRIKEASEIFEQLKEKGILIKNLSHVHPLLKDCLRITVSSEQENAEFVKAFEEVLNS